MSRTVSSALTPTVRTAAKRSIFWIIAAIGIAIIAVVMFLTTGTTDAGAALGADNAAPSGSKALVQVLRDQGVDVEVAADYADAQAAADEESTILLYDPSGILDADRVGALTETAAASVVVTPGFAALQGIDKAVSAGGDPGARTLRADCGIPAAERAGSISAGTHSLITDDADWTACFHDTSGGAALLQSDTGAKTVTLLADDQLLRNESISDRGNAALAIGLLGSEPHLVWYLPGLADAAAGGTASLAELTPAWVTPVLVLGVLVFIAAAIWRGRRFGAVVIENLPVIVPAAETMEGRARLYAKSASRPRAADNLRIGAITRMAARLGLAQSTGADDVILAVAETTRRPVESVRAALMTRVPHTDRELLEISDGIRDLENAMADALSPNAPTTGRMDK